MTTAVSLAAVQVADTDLLSGADVAEGGEVEEEVALGERRLRIGNAAVVTRALQQEKTGALAVEEITGFCVDVLVQLVDESVQLLPLLAGKLQSITRVNPLTQRTGANTLTVGPNE